MWIKTLENSTINADHITHFIVEKKLFMHREDNTYIVYACLPYSKTEEWDSGERYIGRDPALAEKNKNLHGIRIVPHKVAIFKCDKPDAEKKCIGYMKKQERKYTRGKYIGYFVSGLLGSVIGVLAAVLVELLTNKE